MGRRTAIEWTSTVQPDGRVTPGASWNPIRARNLVTGKVGWHCEHVSPGCANCYAGTLNAPYGTGQPYTPVGRKTVEIFVDEKILTEPLRWRDPRKVFVCSMTDLFADFVSDEMIDRVFAVMVLSPRNTFQVLTKRPSRMREYVGRRGTLGMAKAIFILRSEITPAPSRLFEWPLSNVWLGVSVEDQQRASLRVPELLDTVAEVRFVSYEPALEAVDFRCIAVPHSHGVHYWNALTGFRGNKGGGWESGRKLDLVIVGGESGAGARPFDTGWARSVITQCKDASVACFVKQLGARPCSDHDDDPWPRDRHGAFRLKDRKGGDWSEWAADLRVREFPGGE